MTQITISKKEYADLVDKKLHYDYLRHILEDDIFSPPPTKKRKEVLMALHYTKRYSRAFLESLRKGLERSSYFQ